MRKIIFSILTIIIAVSASALDLENGFSLSGGIKTGLLIKNSDYTGQLNKIAHGNKYPMTLFFASEENESYNGEGWLSFGYNSQYWGLNLSFWAHGSLTEYDAKVNLGDHFLWANFLDSRLRFIGGQGGGTPISTDGWLNADWLGYTGLRLFWVDPLGFSIGINFPDPDDGAKAEGIKPVTYLTMIMYGAGYRYKDFFVSVMFDNNPIYDDYKANYDGGLHRDPDLDPIAQAGNIGFGIGIDKLYGGKGNLVFDGIVSNLGEYDVDSTVNRTYKISPIKTLLALKTGYPITESFYAELKAKYTISKGDNADFTNSATWGKFEVEPYASYQIIDNLKFELAVRFAAYINSYYLAEDVSVAGVNLQAGQVSYENGGDYYSQWQLFAEPAIVFTYGGASMYLGYKGEYSRDHVKNKMYIDLRWSF